MNKEEKKIASAADITGLHTAMSQRWKMEKPQTDLEICRCFFGCIR